MCNDQLGRRGERAEKDGRKDLTHIKKVSLITVNILKINVSETFTV